MSTNDAAPQGCADRDSVVVGVDGSESATHALVWAMELAAERGWTVEVVTAWPEAGAPFIHEVSGHFCEARDRARVGQQSALSVASGAVRRMPTVVCLLVNAHPVAALLERAQGARLLVVGSRGADGHRSHPVRESVAETLTLLTPGVPLVVVADPPPVGEPPVDVRGGAGPGSPTAIMSA